MKHWPVLMVLWPLGRDGQAPRQEVKPSEAARSSTGQKSYAKGQMAA